MRVQARFRSRGASTGQADLSFHCLCKNGSSQFVCPLPQRCHPDSRHTSNTNHKPFTQNDLKIISVTTKSGTRLAINRLQSLLSNGCQPEMIAAPCNRLPEFTVHRIGYSLSAVEFLKGHHEITSQIASGDLLSEVKVTCHAGASLSPIENAAVRILDRANCSRSIRE